MLVPRGRLISLELFCLLQDLNLGEYPGVCDSWLDVVSSQGSSLLSLDLSASDVTDSGLTYLKDCKSLQALNLNYCDQISDKGLEQVNGKTTPSNSRFDFCSGCCKDGCHCLVI